MKGRQVSGIMVFFFLLALVLITVGMVFSSRVFTQIEMFIHVMGNDPMMLDSIKKTAVQIMVFGSMMITGISILVILFLHLFRSAARIHREANALREKNDAMESLVQNTRKLAHHQRLETLGTLTSSIAHEFNNLLTPIMGYSLMALEKLQPEEELYDDILEIYQSSLKAKNIISRLSDLSRKNTESVFRPVSPDEIVKKTLDVAMPAKPESVEINLNLNCWDQRITVNEIQMQQLLLNLILNAFQAMGDAGGILTVSTSIDENNVRFQIKDTGCGIPKEMQSKIFEPFFTTKESGKGTGLGLAIAAQVVEDHKGKIRVHSRTGEGTTFTVNIPRVRKAEPEG